VRRVIVAAATIAMLLVVTGCAVAEDRDQARARRAVQEVVAQRGGYPDEPVHCTHTPRPWLVEKQATDYLCAVQLGTGYCDLFRVQFDGFRKTVRLRDHRVDCTLPF
jgi:hypothetical protein